MDTEYDFTQLVNIPQIIDEINTAGLPSPDYLTTNQTTFGTSAVQIFYVQPLTSDQQTTLSTVVAAHVANFNYVSLAQQNQISTLISYLNNSDTTISNVARSVLIKTLGTALPYSQLLTINNTIASTLSG